MNMPASTGAARDTAAVAGFILTLIASSAAAMPSSGFIVRLDCRRSTDCGHHTMCHRKRCVPYRIQKRRANEGLLFAGLLTMGASAVLPLAATLADTSPCSADWRPIAIGQAVGLALLGAGLLTGRDRRLPLAAAKRANPWNASVTPWMSTASCGLMLMVGGT